MAPAASSLWVAESEAEITSGVLTGGVLLQGEYHLQHRGFTLYVAQPSTL